MTAKQSEASKKRMIDAADTFTNEPFAHLGFKAGYIAGMSDPEAQGELLDSAVKTIIEMQNKVKNWSNPNSEFGKDLNECFNIGAQFLSDCPDLFNRYLKLREARGGE